MLLACSALIVQLCEIARLTFARSLVAGPARRASRKLLERMQEFVTVLNMSHRILEFNQENLRIAPLEGTAATSLIRSFPSKVSVQQAIPKPIEPTRTHLNARGG